MRIMEKLLVTPKGIKPSFPDWSVAGVFNPGGARLPNGKIVLYARVAEMPPKARGKGFACPAIIKAGCYKARCDFVPGANVSKRWPNGLVLKTNETRLLTLSHFRRIVLDESGFGLESIAQKPSFTGTAAEGKLGVEDARITGLPGTFAMTYVGVSISEGVSTYLALSKDLRNWKRQGLIFREQNKDAVIFPEKINGKFVALHRPEGAMGISRPSIWISYSPDLAFWGKEKSIVHPRLNAWDSERIGAGTVPLKTEEGWLCLYHGVKKIGAKKHYGAGALLLDLKNPEKILARSSSQEPLLEPVQGYEKRGFVNNVVFPSAALLSLDGKDLLVFCGAADTAISVKKLALNDILGQLEWA